MLSIYHIKHRQYIDILVQVVDAPYSPLRPTPSPKLRVPAAGVWLNSWSFKWKTGNDAPH